MRILVADDSDLVRRAVVGIISSQKDLEVCGEAKDGPDAVQKARELSPDLIVLDVSMPGMGGLEATRLLRQQSPATKVVVISQHDPARLLPHVIQAGGNACIEKSRLGLDLLTSINSFQPPKPF